MEIKNLISIITVLSYMVFVLFSTNIKRDYLVFILYVFPFVDLFITPVSMGGFKVFDVITGITLILLIRKPDVSGVKLSTYTTVLLVLFSMLVLGCLNSEFPRQSFASLLQFSCVMVYSKILADECSRDSQFFKVVIRALKLSCLLSIGFLALQLVFGLGVALYELNPNASRYDGLIRFPSFFQDPQKYGQFLAMMSFLFLIEEYNKKIIQNVVMFLLVIIALFLTGVRAAFSGLCVGLLLVFLFGSARYRIIGIACFVIGFLLVVFYGDMFAMFNRGSNVNDTAEVRFAYWRGALEIYRHSPLLGIGIGNYQQYVRFHAQNQVWEYFGTIEYMDHPESGYLKLLVEFGTGCASILFGLLVFPIVKAFKSILFSAEKKTVLLLTAAVFSWIVAFVTVYSFSDLRIFILVTTLLCLIVVASKQPSKNNTSYEISPK